jgi:hypothetical protein
MWLFKKVKTKHLSFHINGTVGREEHRKFIQKVNEEQIKILNTWTEYHDRSVTPSYINYIIQYK